MFVKLEKLDWVKKIQPAKPTRKNGWGTRPEKDFSAYHLVENFAIEIHADGKLVHKWTWNGQDEARLKAVPKKRWDAFLTAAKEASLTE